MLRQLFDQVGELPGFFVFDQLRAANYRGPYRDGFNIASKAVSPVRRLPIKPSVPVVRLSDRMCTARIVQP